MSKNRLEAFSDGVMAILITIMVLELGFESEVSAHNFMHEFSELIPKLVAYAVSFLMLGIMWVNHHALFHGVRQVTNGVLWANLALLFFMSLVPFATGVVGSAAHLWQAAMLYGLTFAACVVGFMLIRWQVLVSERDDRSVHHSINRKNLVALLLYLLGAGSGLLSVYISYAFFLMVPLMYLIPSQPSKNIKT
ncbi:MAG: DUF1211 domain-containing protein [Bacteroidetes bacterium]|nr:MAG: DUF1211 domain-containing protein [Bacteroidota bacterium]